MKVRAVLDAVRAEGRTALTAPEGKRCRDAYGIAVPAEALATSPTRRWRAPTGIGLPVVLKIVSPDILHKTDAGGVLVGVDSAADVAAALPTDRHDRQGVRPEGARSRASRSSRWCRPGRRSSSAR